MRLLPQPGEHFEQGVCLGVTLRSGGRHERICALAVF